MSWVLEGYSGADTGLNVSGRTGSVKKKQGE